LYFSRGASGRGKIRRQGRAAAAPPWGAPAPHERHKWCIPMPCVRQTGREGTACLNPLQLESQSGSNIRREKIRFERRAQQQPSCAEKAPPCSVQKVRMHVPRTPGGMEWQCVPRRSPGRGPKAARKMRREKIPLKKGPSVAVLRRASPPCAPHVVRSCALCAL
jgi:hypothetical protein